ncbi:VIT domain-containing protein [Actinophytocola glycyrrhizae]|uniref:VIT domain-containing protein n=1 Tax=Actinophytocola glycyrrhizae TaxID=2044873 RepID=A0ABV9S2S6_9PSEU
MSTQIELIDQAEVTARPTDDDGLGCLRTKHGNLPLESIDVRTRITGLASHTELTQGFHNTHDEPLEATYVFPLPPRAAVTAMRMAADGRVVDGVLKERGEARATYDKAVQEGRRASIAEEERPGVFTMRVGNILPGERVTVHLTLAGALSYEDGEATYRFPLVVAPKYIPGRPVAGDQVGDGTALDTDEVPDASRISPPVLLPGFPNPVDLSVEVHVDAAGLPLAGVRSSLHATATEDAADGLRVRLNPGERADRDFLLRLRVGDEAAVSTALAVLPDEDEQGGTFALTVLPPTGEAPEHGRDVVLVLDRSGSMGGWKMVAARRAAARIVDTLGGDDRFAVLAFDYQVDTPPGLPDQLAEATDRNRFRAVEFLANLDARGGTEMLTPLRRAADLLHGTAARERVLVLVTDGQIGNEDQILYELAPKLSGVRVHTVGIDRAVNEGFLQRLAGTRGRCELVESEDRLDEAMHNIHRRIGNPLVTDLLVTQDGLAVDTATVAPTPIPDVFPGAPVVVMGRYSGPPHGAVTVAGQPNLRTTLTATRSDNPALAALWARANIRDLEDKYVTGQTALEGRIVETSLKFGVLSRFTAFVAVDQRVVNEGGATRRVTQPVDLPSGWEVPDPGNAPTMAARAAGMPTFGAAARFAAAESTGGAPAGGYGMQGGLDTSHSAPAGDVYAGPPPGVPMRGGLPAPAPGVPGRPPAASPRKRGRPAPAPDDGTSLAAFVREELTRLRGGDGQDVWLRAGLMTALSERIRVLLATWQQNNEPLEARTTLGTLSTELAAPTADPAEVDRRWQKALSTLESLAGDGNTRSRRTFWKR